MEKDSTMKLSSVTWQTILISTILSGYVPAYKVQSWISSHLRKSTMDMFPQRELSKKGKWKLTFDSYDFLLTHVEAVVKLEKLCHNVYRRRISRNIMMEMG